ncbi:MAG TPA: zinc-binding alcohol dehydrogenase family protein [Acidobacteriaceae bacterium]|jgi:threonine dehydrogenase-like Zn-dependent dehydrogenase|nr:zinc-binding alcohol dehydrogenase family protein [Acidobacteriaceae bacterium]
MKALMLDAPGRARLAEIPHPGKPGPAEVLLQIRMVGLCGSDLSTFAGKNPLVTYPRVPGHEIAAEIAEAGAEVPSEWRSGLPVTLLPYSNCGQCAACRRGRLNACRNNQTLGVQRDGALTEFLLAPWSRLKAAPGLPLRTLAMVEPLTVGAHAVRRGRVTAADTVLVIGCGMVGLGAVAAAAFRGARVIAMDMDNGKLEVARRAGARDLLHAGEAAAIALADLTGGEGPDVVIEAVGTPRTFQLAVTAVSFTGRVVYIGYAKEPVSYETRLFVQKELDILGSRNATEVDFDEVIAMLTAGGFPVDDAVSVVVPLEEAGTALASWNDDPSSMRKIMVAVGARTARP